mgnify:CR=1 FL=1
MPCASTRLAFALCLITLAVNLQAPLYITYADLSGQGAAATAVACCCEACRTSLAALAILALVMVAAIFNRLRTMPASARRAATFLSL